MVPEPTDTPEPTRPPVSAPILSINGIQSSDTVVELVGDECAIAWSAGGDVSGYAIRILDASGNELINESSTKDTQRTFQTSILNPGEVYTIGIGAIPASGGDTIWTVARFMRPALPTEAPTSAPTVGAVGKPSIQIWQPRNEHERHSVSDGRHGDLQLAGGRRCCGVPHLPDQRSGTDRKH